MGHTSFQKHRFGQRQNYYSPPECTRIVKPSNPLERAQRVVERAIFLHQDDNVLSIQVGRTWRGFNRVRTPYRSGLVAVLWICGRILGNDSRGDRSTSLGSGIRTTLARRTGSGALILMHQYEQSSARVAEGVQHTW
jgi:hypothetical protein